MDRSVTTHATTVDTSRRTPSPLYNKPNQASKAAPVVDTESSLQVPRMMDTMGMVGGWLENVEPGDMDGEASTNNAMDDLAWYFDAVEETQLPGWKEE